MDMVDGYGDGGDPVIEKSQFILSLFEQLDKKEINAKERSIIDRCVGEVYEEYQHGGAVPTLRVLREKFLEQEEPEAQDLALVSELFTNGSLDAFAASLPQQPDMTRFHRSPIPNLLHQEVFRQ